MSKLKVEIEKDDLDDLFVCENCGKSIANYMPGLRYWERQLRMIRECVDEAHKRIKELQSEVQDVDKKM